MSAPYPDEPPRSAAPDLGRQMRSHTFALLAFWLVVGGLLWAGFSWWEARGRESLQPYEAGGGELVIPRSPDGHFYVPGEINHVRVQFLVDTGASAVAISDQVARQAGLPEGAPITVRTANGDRDARRVTNVPVKAGHLTRNDVTVTTGLALGSADDALLGQSFLRHFDVQIDGSGMRLRPR